MMNKNQTGESSLEYLFSPQSDEFQHADYYEKVSITMEMAYAYLVDHYDEMGWDIKTDMPAKETQREPGLHEVIADLKQRGLL